jgi:hypothetical protein
LAQLFVETSADGETLIRKFETDIRKTAFLKNIVFGDVSEAEIVETGGVKFNIKL